MLEQNVQNLLLQKQTFQSQLIEVESAVEELEKTKGKSYKIVGAVMIESDKADLKKELDSKKEVLSLRVKTLDNQEKQFKDKASALQTDILSQLKSDKEKE